MNQKNLFSRSALAIAVAIVSSNAGAAGFLLNEYSTSALGRAFSGLVRWATTQVREAETLLP